MNSHYQVWLGLSSQYGGVANFPVVANLCDFTDSERRHGLKSAQSLPKSVSSVHDEAGTELAWDDRPGSATCREGDLNPHAFRQ